MDGNTECNSQLSQPAVSASEPGEPNEDDDTFAIETTQNPAMSAPAKRLRHNQEEPVQEETVQEETVQQHQRQRQRDERDRRARDRDLATVGLLETCETIISPEPPRAIHGVWMQFPLNADSLEVLQGVYRHIANALDAAGLVEHLTILLTTRTKKRSLAPTILQVLSSTLTMMILLATRTRKSSHVQPIPQVLSSALTIQLATRSTMSMEATPLRLSDSVNASQLLRQLLVGGCVTAHLCFLQRRCAI